jgi:hypothetical protein
VENECFTRISSVQFSTACETKNYDLVKWILQNMIVEWTDSSILHLFRTTPNILILVLKNLPQPSYFWTVCSIDDCAKYGWYGCLKVLLQYLTKYYPLELLRRDTLTHTCEKGAIKCVEILISDPRVDPRDFNAGLFRACWQGYVEIVKLLVSSGKIDLHHKDNKALRVAMKYKQEAVVKFLLEQ